MLALGLILAVIGLVFTFRWFSHHKFEYLDGVKPSEQIDCDLLLGLGFSFSAIIVFFNIF